MSRHRSFGSFAEFYPFYLSEHANRMSRRLHFAGSTFALVLLAAALCTGNWWLAAAPVVEAYALAWIGHFFFEKNTPATFRYPGLSLAGDWRLWWDIVTRKTPL